MKVVMTLLVRDEADIQRSVTLEDDAALAEEVHVVQAMASVVRLSSRIAKIEDRGSAERGREAEPRPCQAPPSPRCHRMASLASAR